MAGSGTVYPETGRAFGSIRRWGSMMQQDDAECIGAGLKALPPGNVLRRLRAADAALFRAVGQHWLWFSRLRLMQEKLCAIPVDEQVFAFALMGPENDACHGAECTKFHPRT